MSISTHLGAGLGTRAAIAAALGLTLATAACSGGSSGLAGAGQAGAGQPPGQAAGAVASAAPAAAGKVSQITVRFANFFIGGKGKPGPGLDVYDVPTGQAAKPLLTDVAYGTVSAYVHPHLVPNSLPGQAIANLYVLPTGEDPVADKADAQSIGAVADDGSHPQLTVLLLPQGGGILGSEPLSGLSFTSRVEKGDFNGSKAPVAPPPPSGRGEILVDDSPATGYDMGNLGMYLMNDSSCAPPANGDPSIPGLPYIFNSASSKIVSGFAVFPTAPGTHQVSVVPWSSSVTPTCAQLTHKQGTISIDVAAGQQVEAYVYGTSPTDLHLAAAAIQQ